MVTVCAAPDDRRITSNASETRSTLTRIKGFRDSTETTIQQYDILRAEHMQHLNMHNIVLLFPRKPLALVIVATGLRLMRSQVAALT